MELHPVQIDRAIQNALKEDWGFGDLTTNYSVPLNKQASAKIIAKESCVLAGVDVAKRVFKLVDPDISIKSLVPDSTVLDTKQVVLEIKGNARNILKAERVALNFLMRMCGIATLTSSFVKKISSTKARLLDTRKTTPGIRIFEKYATNIGGARNHRFSLSDGVILKENHIRAAGGIELAIHSLKQNVPPGIKVEIEVTSLEELDLALKAGADIIMLDNMSPEDMKKAVEVRNKCSKALLEASGNVELSTISDIAATGVDFISTSSPIRSAKWSDLSLLFDI